MSVPFYGHGFISYVKYNDLQEWYITGEADELIEFKEEDGTQRNLNSLMIETDTAGVYIQMLPSNYCLYIPPTSNRVYNYSKMTAIKVIGSSGQTIRWHGSYY
jgi:hypothetical protein